MNAWHSFGVEQCALSVLSPVCPLALVPRVVQEPKRPVAVLLIVFVVSLIGFAIRPFRLPLSVHHVLMKVPLVDLAIPPGVDALAVDAVFQEVPAVLRAVGELQRSLAAHFAIPPFALELEAILPDLLAVAFPHVVDPLSVVF